MMSLPHSQVWERFSSQAQWIDQASWIHQGQSLIFSTQLG